MCSVAGNSRTVIVGMFGRWFAVCILTTSFVSNVNGGKLFDEVEGDKKNSSAHAQGIVVIKNNFLLRYSNRRLLPGNKYNVSHNTVINSQEIFNDFPQEKLRRTLSIRLFPIYRRKFRMDPLRSNLHRDSAIILAVPDVPKLNLSREYEPTQPQGRSVTSTKKMYKLPNNPRRIKKPLRTSAVRKVRAIKRSKGVINRYSLHRPPSQSDVSQELDQRYSNENADELTYTSHHIISPYKITQVPEQQDDVEDILGSEIHCVDGLIFNGNGKCVCPAGYLLTRSFKCIKAKSRIISKL